MTMKMMRSTSTTSTNGVTLMSDLMEPLPPTCMTLCLSGLLGLGDQTDVVEADLAAGFEHVENVSVHHLAIAFDGHFPVRCACVNLFQRRLHLIFPHDLRPEIHGAVGLEGDLELLL